MGMGSGWLRPMRAVCGEAFWRGGVVRGGFGRWEKGRLRGVAANKSGRGVAANKSGAMGMGSGWRSDGDGFGR